MEAKKIVTKRALLLVVCLLLTLLACGCEQKKDFTSGEYDYHLYDNGQAELRAYRGDATELTLPAELDKHPVTSVHLVYPATDFHNLVSVVIPEGYTAIHSSVFKDCKKLESVTLPSTLQSIDYDAFRGCESLRAIELPEGLTALENAAFASTALQTVTIPDSLTWDSKGIFGGNPFADCKQLKEFVVSEDHPAFRWKDGVLFNREETTLAVYPAARTDEMYTVPDTVKSFDRNAFRGAPLKKAVLPEGLTSLSNSTFADCEELETVILPASLTDIESSAFTGCTALKNIELPENLKTIGQYAFQGCTSLERLAIPKGVETIGDHCFTDCKALTLEVYEGEKQDRHFPGAYGAGIAGLEDHRPDHQRRHGLLHFGLCVPGQGL